MCQVLVAAHKICDHHCCMQTLSCSMGHLVPWPGIELGPSALGVWSLSHWITREVPQSLFCQPLYFLLLLLLLLSHFRVWLFSCVRPHRRQPTRLPHPWDSPGKNTGVGCHFLLQCVEVKSEREVAQLCPTLSDPMDCSLPGSAVHRIFQARVLDISTYICTHKGKIFGKCNWTGKILTVVYSYDYCCKKYVLIL